MIKKRTKRWNTDSKQGGSGDFYGTGKKNPVGKLRSDTVEIAPVSKKGLKKPPKKLA